MKKSPLFLFLMAVLFSNSSMAVATLSPGGTSCRVWLQERRVGVETHTDYLSGVLSGIAWWTHKDILAGKNPMDLITKRMDNYCEMNPQNDMLDGVDSIIHELEKKRSNELAR